MNKLLAGAALATVIAAPAVAAPVELIVNGDFEMGAFSGWAKLNQGSGDFYLDAPGTSTPVGNLPTPANPNGGGYYAVTDTTGPGLHVLAQTFTVPVGTTELTLTFDLFVANRAPSFVVNPAGLTPSVNPNQHARVDILADGSDLSAGGAAILSNLILATSNSSYISYSFDLSSLVAGQNYILRFAEVDNQGVFNLGVDNVSLLADIAPVPEPAALALFGLGIAGLGLVRRRRMA